MSARLFGVAALLAVLAIWTHARPGAASTSRASFEQSIPIAFGEWIGQPAPPLEPEVAKVLAADEYVHRYYDVRGLQNREGYAPIEMDIAATTTFLWFIVPPLYYFGRIVRRSRHQPQ